MSASTAPSLLYATLTTACAAGSGTVRPSRGRLLGWLARKSRARLTTGARALLAPLAPGDQRQLLALDCLRGTPDGRLARLRGAATASVDAVVSLGALADAPDAGALLAEIQRVLRPGGRLLFAEPVSAPVGSRRRRVQRLLGRLWPSLAGTANDPRDLWNDLKAARFERLHYQRATLSTFAGLPVPYIAGQATAATVVTQPLAAPGTRPAHAGAIALPWRQPAFAFFGN